MTETENTKADKLKAKAKADKLKAKAKADKLKAKAKADKLKAKAKADKLKVKAKADKLKAKAKADKRKAKAKADKVGGQWTIFSSKTMQEKTPLIEKPLTDKEKPLTDKEKAKMKKEIEDNILVLKVSWSKLKDLSERATQLTQTEDVKFTINKIERALYLLNIIPKWDGDKTYSSITDDILQEMHYIMVSNLQKFTAEIGALNKKVNEELDLAV